MAKVSTATCCASTCITQRTSHRTPLYGKTVGVHAFDMRNGLSAESVKSDVACIISQARASVLLFHDTILCGGRPPTEYTRPALLRLSTIVFLPNSENESHHLPLWLHREIATIHFQCTLPKNERRARMKTKETHFRFEWTQIRIVCSCSRNQDVNIYMVSRLISNACMLLVLSRTKVKTYTFIFVLVNGSVTNAPRPQLFMNHTFLSLSSHSLSIETW